MEDIPTMPQLQLLELSANQDGEDLRIVQDIGTHYLNFGTRLLNDEQGSQVKSLEHQFQRDCNAINWNILQAWISGKGRKPISWKTLVTVLREIQLEVLAQKIETSLAHHSGFTASSSSGQRKTKSDKSTNADRFLTGTIAEAVIPPTTTTQSELTVLVRPHSTAGSFIAQISSNIFLFTSLAIAFIVLLIAVLVVQLLRQ